MCCNVCSVWFVWCTLGRRQEYPETYQENWFLILSFHMCKQNRFCSKFCNKKSIQTRYFPNEKSFFYEFSPSEATIREYTSKTLEHLYFGTSHYSLNAVGLLPNSFNSFNYEGFKLKRNKLAAAEHLGYEVFLLTLSKL